MILFPPPPPAPPPPPPPLPPPLLLNITTGTAELTMAVIDNKLWTPRALSVAHPPLLHRCQSHIHSCHVKTTTLIFKLLCCHGV